MTEEGRAKFYVVRPRTSWSSFVDERASVLRSRVRRLRGAQDEDLRLAGPFASWGDADRARKKMVMVCEVMTC